MMKVLRNYLPNSGAKVITQGTNESTYQSIPIPGQLRGQTVSLSFESELLAGNPSSQHIRVRDTVRNAWTDPMISTNLPQEGRVIWENISIPTGSQFAFFIYNGEAYNTTLNNDFARWDMHLTIGEKASDTWVPAEEDLTPEQRLALPPYGEYKEIKSF